MQELDFLLTEIQKRQSPRRQQCVFGEIDKEALEITGESNFFEALRTILQELYRLLLLPEQTNHTILQISGCSWILSRSTVIDRYINLDSTTSQLMLSLSAIGEYFSGIHIIYSMIQKSEYRPMFKNIQLSFVPSSEKVSRTTSRMVDMDLMEKDWYTVIKEICPFTKGYDYTRENVLKKFPRLKRYSKLLLTTPKRFFLWHPEKTLVTYLIQNSYEPTKIGVSKPSCLCCSEYISALNNKKGYGLTYQNSKWEVSGKHGGIDGWARDREEGKSGFSRAEGGVRGGVEGLVRRFTRGFQREVVGNGDWRLGDEMDEIMCGGMC